MVMPAVYAHTSICDSPYIIQEFRASAVPPRQQRENRPKSNLRIRLIARWLCLNPEDSGGQNTVDGRTTLGSCVKESDRVSTRAKAFPRGLGRFADKSAAESKKTKSVRFPGRSSRVIC